MKGDLMNTQRKCKVQLGDEITNLGTKQNGSKFLT